MAFIPQTGSTVAFQGNPSLLQATVGLNSTNASVITVGSPVANQSISGTIGASVIGHAPVVIVGGSVAASFTPPSNQSVSGTVGTTQSGTWISSIVNTVPSSVIVGASIFGQLPAGTAMLGSVAAYQGAVWNVAGSVAAVQTGTWSTSVMTNVITSIATAGQVMGSVAALQATNPWNIAGSVASHIRSGSVIAVLGGNTSVLAIQSGTVITSISGIPQASIHGSVSIVPASVITGNASLVGAASVQVLSAASGVRNYVTAFLVSNTGATTTLVTFTDGDASVIGKTIAPAGGGSNAPALATPFIPSVNKVVNVVAATATSVLHVWVGGYRAP